MPLTRREVSPSGTLLEGRPKLDPHAASTVERAYQDGVAVRPKPGRVDDFTWPPRS